MLSITEGAGAHLSELLAEMNCPDGTAVRFRCQADGPVLSLDSRSPGDASFAHDGRIILLLDENTARFLQDQTLDVEQTESGPRLHVARSVTSPSGTLARSPDRSPAVGR